MTPRSVIIAIAVLTALPGSVAGPGPEHRTGEGSRIGVLVPDRIDGVPAAASSPVTHSASTAPPESPVASPVRLGTPSLLDGRATWYRWRPGEAAAGPALRRMLGRSWRGTLVRVRRGDRSVTVRLTDWCRCPGNRMIDLDVRAFAALGDPSRGVLSVEHQEGKG